MSAPLFAGDLPAAYDRYLAPTVFAPWAEHAAALVAEVRPARVLELAAGTGVGTRALIAALDHDAAVVATDISADMLAHAAQTLDDPRVRWLETDAQQLPFEDGAFDAVLFQFGVMFLPDRERAFAGIRRVLAPGGRLVMTSWDAPGTNAYHAPVDAAVVAVFAADDPPTTARRAAHSYHDADVVRGELSDAGFTHVDVYRTRLVGRARAVDIARGFGLGSPIAAAAQAQGVSRERLVSALQASVTAQLGAGPFDLPMSALVTTAR